MLGQVSPGKFKNSISLSKLEIDYVFHAISFLFVIGERIGVPSESNLNWTQKVQIYIRAPITACICLNALL